MMETLLSLGAGALAALWIRKTIGYILRIQGKSMNPTLKDGQNGMAESYWEKLSSWRYCGLQKSFEQDFD